MAINPDSAPSRKAGAVACAMTVDSWVIVGVDGSTSIRSSALSRLTATTGIAHRRHHRHQRSDSRPARGRPVRPGQLQPQHGRLLPSLWFASVRRRSSASTFESFLKSTIVASAAGLVCFSGRRTPRSPGRGRRLARLRQRLLLPLPLLLAVSFDVQRQRHSLGLTVAPHALARYLWTMRDRRFVTSRPKRKLHTQQRRQLTTLVSG